MPRTASIGARGAYSSISSSSRSSGGRSESSHRSFSFPLLPRGKIAAGIFLLWAVFLSGFVSDAMRTPGVLQALRLKDLLLDKRAHIAKLEDEIRAAKAEIALLETSAVVQQREIRRVLGYAAPDELIFDFSEPERLE